MENNIHRVLKSKTQGICDCGWRVLS